MVDQLSAIKNSLRIVKDIEKLLKRGLFRGTEGSKVQPSLNYLSALTGSLEQALEQSKVAPIEETYETTPDPDPSVPEAA